jgi:hypothetical protein
MPPRSNPLHLNALQLKTLTLLQELAKLADHGRPGTEPGTVEVRNLPRPHGDHFHFGDAAVAARDASGLANPSVWVALERKGLIKSGFPHTALLTAAGLAYDTGMAEGIKHRTDH